MKKTLILAILFLLSLTASVRAVTEASDSSDINSEMIKENIKKRIEQAAKSQSSDADRKKTAYLGTMSSVTTNSFSLETSQGGIRQASTSAFTTYIDVNNKNKEVKFEDISLGDYIAALGFLDEDTKVLDARRVLVLRVAPTSSTKKTFFGTLQKVDLKKNTVTLQNPKGNQEKTFTFTADTDFSAMTETSRKSTISIKSIPLLTNVIVTYTPKSAGTGEVISTLLVKTTPPTPSPSPVSK